MNLLQMVAQRNDVRTAVRLKMSSCVGAYVKLFICCILPILIIIVIIIVMPIHQMSFIAPKFAIMTDDSIRPCSKHTRTNLLHLNFRWATKHLQWMLWDAVHTPIIMSYWWVTSLCSIAKSQSSWFQNISLKHKGTFADTPHLFLLIWWVHELI